MGFRLVRQCRPYCVLNDVNAAGYRCYRGAHFIVRISKPLPACLRMSSFRFGEAVQNLHTSPYLRAEKPVYINLNKGDQAYFDFKELERNASAEKKMDYFVSLMYETFQLTQEEVENIVEHNPSLWKEFLPKTFNHLEALQVKKETFLHYPWMVSLPPEEIDAKIAIISNTYPDLADLNINAILLKYTAEKLEMLVTSWKEEAKEFEYPSKFHFIADKLKVTLEDVFNQVATKSFLLTFPYARIQEGLTLCLEAGIRKRDLFNDLWTLRNRPAKMRNRVEALQQFKIPVKPWVLRTSIHSFETHIREYWQMKSDLDNYDDATAYLIARLQCNLSDVEKMMKVFPNLEKATIPRLKPILDYLLIEKGVKTNLIVMCPRILCQKLETVKARIERLDATGIKYSSFWMVCRSQRDFDQFFNRWKPK